MLQKILISILILFFLLLIISQTFLGVKEGLENNTYTNYNINNPNNALILAQQNAGNISYIKGKLDGLMNLQSQVNDISGNVVTLQTQMQGLVQQQAQLAQSVVGSSPPTITGTTT